MIRCSLLLLVSVLLVACSTPQFHPVTGIQTQAKIEADTFVMSDGYRLPLKQFWPKEQTKALVLALHGFNDYSKAFDGMCEYLVANQVACIAYDQRGFGQTDLRGFWPQEGQHEKDLKQILRLLKSNYSNLPVYFAGESMGGAVILSALSEDHAFWEENVNGTILFAPAVWARSTQPWYQRLGLWIAVHTFPGWKPTGESLEIVATDNRDALREMYYDENVIKETRIDAIYGLTNLMDKALASAEKQSLETLILYGEKDEVIPKKPTCEMLVKTDNLETPPNVVLYPNGYHMLTRDLQAEVVFSDVLDWVQSSKNISTKKDRLEDFCQS